jgi:hypothetical protein
LGDDWRRFGIDSLRAVKKVHKINKVHGSVRFENIFLSTGDVLLKDFTCSTDVVEQGGDDDALLNGGISNRVGGGLNLLSSWNDDFEDQFDREFEIPENMIDNFDYLKRLSFAMTVQGLKQKI